MRAWGMPLLAVVLVVSISTAAFGDEPAGVRDLERIEFSGVEAFDIAEVRDVLSFDFELLLAAHPQAPLDTYLETLQAQVKTGYRHGGFPEAKVETRYNAAQKQIEVRVVEGTRFRCGDVQIVGVTKVRHENLIRRMTEAPKPSQIIWKEGKPVPFDEETVGAMRRALILEFADAGFFHPDFKVPIKPDERRRVADLEITIVGDGKPTVLGRISVQGSKRDTAAQVRKYLDFEKGIPFDRGLKERVEKRLAESGRFLTVGVSHRDNRPLISFSGNETRDLRVVLRDYEKAPPLAQDLSPIEQALLKLRDWIERWKDGDVDEDLVMTATTTRTIPPAVRSLLNANQFASDEPVEVKLTARMTVAPDRGQTIALRAARTGGEPLIDVAFAAYPDRLILADRQRHEKLILPNSIEDRLVFSAKGAANQSKPKEDDDGPFYTFCGMGWSSRSTPVPTPFEVQMDFSPVFMVGLAHHSKFRCNLHGRKLEIQGEKSSMTIDAESGRPDEFRWWDKDHRSELAVRSERGALTADLNAFEQSLTASRLAYDEHSHWKSPAEFVLDQWLLVSRNVGSEQGAESVGALRKLIRRWAAPAVAALFDPWHKLSPKSEDSFYLPYQFRVVRGRIGFEPGGMGRQNLMARTVLPVYRRLVPRTGPLWPMGRDAALFWASGNATPAASVQQALEWRATGPVGELFAGSFAPFANLPVSAVAGKEGLRRLTLDGFRHDYAPFLEGDSWLGEAILSLADAVRELDDADVQALTRFFPEGERRKAVLDSLTLLKAHPEEPVEQILPRAFDRIWEGIFRADVEAALTALAHPSGRPSKVHFDAKIQPAAATETRKKPQK